MQSVMGVGGDDHFHPALFAHAQVHVGEVQAIGVRIALHGHAVLCRRIQNFRHVVVERIAAQQQASGGMPDDLCIGILDGCEHAVGHGRTVEVHIGVDRAHHHLELREQIVGIIE